MSTTTGIGTSDRPLRVAIVGSGPAGFYAAIALQKQTRCEVRIDILDCLPTPFGLVRGGVAPDHPKIKTVTRVYEKCAVTPGCRFLGNVRLGTDVEVADLRGHYHQIVYAVGNERARSMGIPGEELTGCTPATVFVGWYNAHPDHADAQFDWNSERVVVVGNGNVAVDVARILSKTREELEQTDIADHALEKLAASRVREVIMLGRRGPVQAAFTPAEMKELTELPGVDIVVDPSELELDPGSRAALEEASPKSSARRNYEILSAAAGTSPSRPRSIRFRFCESPVELLGDDSGRVRGIRLVRNELAPDDAGVLRPRPTDVFTDLEVDWVFPAIGYQDRPIPGVPFDERRRLIANVDGRVCDPSSREPKPGQYVVGWAKSGPQGLIGMHKAASASVVELMLQDLESGIITGVGEIDDSAILEFLDARGVRYVTWDDWKRIDAAEVQRGQSRGAPRSKFCQIPEMLEVLNRQT
jgi:ferredoxin--NADP+ reductase